MGTVTTRIELLSQRDSGRTHQIAVLVDTGATLSVLPRPLLEELGVDTAGQVTIRLGDGRRIARDVGEVRMQVEGTWVWARVVFGEPADPSVLGLTVLELLGLTVDPVARRLIPTEFILY